MAEYLVKQLRWMEDVRKKDISCPVPCINECFFKEVADAIEQLIKERDDWKTTAKIERDGMWEWFEAYQKDVPLWISVAKRLPEENGFYLCLYEAKQPGGIAMDEGLSILQYLDNKWRLNEIYTVTHWMPLQEPPKGEDNG